MKKRIKKISAMGLSAAIAFSFLSGAIFANQGNVYAAEVDEENPLTDDEEKLSEDTDGENDIVVYIDEGEDTIDSLEISSDDNNESDNIYEEEVVFDVNEPVDTTLPEEESSESDEVIAPVNYSEEASVLEDADASGVFGENDSMSWELKQGTLTISGEGTVDDGNPWSDYSDTITALVISDGITYIGTSCFRGYKNLKSVTISDTVTEIGESAFFECKNLTNVSFGNHLEYINRYAFRECGTLSLDIPASLTALTPLAFLNTYVESVTVAPDSEYMISIDNVVYNKDQTLLYYCAQGKTGSYIMPETVETIATYAFSGSQLNQIVMSDHLESISNNAFYKCKNLKEITMPDSVVKTGHYLFSECSALESVKLASGLEEVGSHWFSGCSSLKHVEFGAKIWLIDAYAFENCTSLTSVELPESLEEIYSCAFHDTGITSIRIPASVMYIASNAFNYKCDLQMEDENLIATDSGTYIKVYDLPLTVTYQQESAREMLKIVNEFRTGEDAWYMSPSGAKSYCEDLKEYVYDYDLEKMAMLRAAELALRDSHTRPTGQSCFTAYYNYNNTNTYWGENISGFFSSPQTIFNIWAEENESYWGQGHRRNMLSDRYNAIGIGHVICNGMHYWVQEFAYFEEPNTNFEEANNEEAIVNIRVAQSIITDKNVEAGEEIWLSLGETVESPSATVNMKLTANNRTSNYSEKIIPKWKIQDNGILQMAKGQLKAINVGTTTIQAELYGESVSTTVIVTQDISKAEVSDVVSQSFTGLDICPEPLVKITVNGKKTKLQKNRDYTVSYKNNSNVGTATISITGIGNYTGTIEKNFKITMQNGFAKASDNNWYYYKNSAVQKKSDVISGIVDGTKERWYVDSNGKVDTTFTGMTKSSELGWVYVSQGKFYQAYTGMAKNSYGWWYMKNGKLDNTYTGLSNNAYGKWYINKGKLDTTMTGMYKDASKGWVYLNKGKWDTSFTDVAKNSYGQWYMVNGRLDTSLTGMHKAKTYGWIYVNKGKWDTGYTGMAKNAYGWWYMKNGKLDQTYTGMAKNAYGWWYIRNGKLDQTYTGMAKNAYGWWYMKNGKLHTTFTGIAQNEYGSWYMVKGKLAGKYNGKVTYNSKTYSVKNGKATVI